jgi:hypothetical protein
LNNLVGGDVFSFIIPSELHRDLVFQGQIIQNDPFNAEVRTEVTGLDGVQTVLYENITDIANRVDSRMTRTTSNLSNFSSRHTAIDLNQLVDLDDDSIDEARNDDTDSLPEIVNIS